MKTITGILAIVSVVPLSAQVPLYNSGNLYVKSGVEIAIAGDFHNGSTGSFTEEGKMTAFGNFKNEGTFTQSSGELVLKGSSQKNIFGSCTFNNLTIENGGSDVLLNDDIEVDGNLTMTSGNIDLFGSNIVLGSTASIINESGAHRIKGTSGEITTTRFINAPVSLNPGNIGIALTSAENLGLTTIDRGHEEQLNIGSPSIERYFDITPTNNSDLFATLRFYYFDNETNTLSESDLDLWKSADAGISWINQPKDGYSVDSNFLEKSSISSFSRWAAAALPDPPLTVNLIEMSCSCVSGRRIVSWATATETNTFNFIVERSLDNYSFTQVSSINAAGNSNQSVQYSFTDHEYFMGILYYKITLTDVDGTKNLLGSLTSEPCAGAARNANISVYPNPFTAEIQIEMKGACESDILYTITDEMSKIVMTGTLKSSLKSKWTLYLHQLAKGGYFLTLNYNGEKTILKIIKD